MSQQTMTEKEMFLRSFEKEYETTMRLLQAYPEGKLELKPAEKSRPARDLIWTLVTDSGVMADLIGGRINLEKMQAKPPATLREMLSTYEKYQRDSVARIKSAPEEDFNKTVAFLVAPKKVADMRRGDALWFVLSDVIHHRGQLSVYMRIAGAKVPSIYGPTADEPW